MEGEEKERQAVRGRRRQAEAGGGRRSERDK